jgi:pyruvate dehydrogenase E2 component (dihydrolipoamide acetyltransferase)
MPVPVHYPKVSVESDSGRIARWLVADGAAVTAGQALFEIENDKAAVEVEAPAGGVLRILVAEGAEVAVGAEVATVTDAGAQPAAGTAAPPPRPAPAPLPVAATPSLAAAPAPVQPPAPGPDRRTGPNPTPLARRIARENGMTLDGLAGSGPGGRVQRRDVLAALAGRTAATPAATGATGDGLLNGAWLRTGEGPPVVLLHGFGADLNAWRLLLAGARTGFGVLALDLPAHGGSPRSVPPDLDALCAAVEATLAAGGVGGCVIAGHSFGAAVATRIAARARTDVRALCLFAPAGLGPAIDHAFVDGLLRARSAASLRPWLEHMVHDPATVSEALVAAAALQRADGTLAEAQAAFAGRFFPDGTQAVSIRADLAALRIPARVVFGRQDRILPFAATRDLPGHVGLHALDLCGHVPQMEHPDLCLRLLAELWRSAA